MPAKKKQVKQQAVSVNNDVDERMVPSKHKGFSIYGEHMARYEAAVSLVKGKRVLDIASGSGYGVSLLAKTASHVVGVDVSADAIDFSKKEYGARNVTFKASDGRTIPLNDNEFDVVVSFETIEHLDDYEFFMTEIKRVLKPDGLFVLSTPNELEFAEGNHFHLHEFEHDELAKLIKKYYKYMEPYYQATWVGNLVGTEAEMTDEWRKTIPVEQFAPIDQKRFLYFYFLCSDRPVTEKVETRFTISQHSSDRRIHERELQIRDQALNSQAAIDSYRTELDRIRGILDHYEKNIVVKNAKRIKRLARRIKRLVKK